MILKKFKFSYSCIKLGRRFRSKSFLFLKRRSLNETEYIYEEITKEGTLYFLSNNNTLIRVRTVLNGSQIDCFDEKLTQVISTSLQGRSVKIGTEYTIEETKLYPLYIFYENQLEVSFFADSLNEQHDWLEAMMLEDVSKHSLSLEGLNLESGHSNTIEKKKRDKWASNSFFHQNAMPLAAVRDLEDQQTALRRSTLLKQRIISTELKVDSLKKPQPDTIYEKPSTELYYESQLDELNIKLDNYTEAFDKERERLPSTQICKECNELMETCNSKRRSVAIGEKFARFLGQEETSASDMEDNYKSKKSALRSFGNFLDVKLRKGHKRTKSEDLKLPNAIQSYRPRSATHCNARKESLQGNLNQQKTLRTEIDGKTLAEIEAFEKLIKIHLHNHSQEYSL